MRVVLVAALLSALTLAGCNQGTPPEDDFEPSCPAWTKGLSTTSFSGPGWFHPNGTNTDAWDSNETRPVGGGQLELNDHPLDFLRLDFYEKKDKDGNVMLRNGTPIQQFLYVEKGILHAEFLHGETMQPLMVYDTSRGPPGSQNPPSESLVWQPGMYTNFTIHIELKPSSQPADPAPVFMHWSLAGTRNGNGDVSAWALREATLYFWYRTCNADGSEATAGPR